jgi:hypothetical protein
VRRWINEAPVAPAPTIVSLPKLTS